MQPACGQGTQAPVEVRVPLAPQPVAASDGLVHIAYELHVTNYYQSTGTLHLQQLTVWAEEGPRVLGRFAGPALNRLLAHPATGPDTVAVPLEADFYGLTPGSRGRLRSRTCTFR